MDRAPKRAGFHLEQHGEPAKTKPPAPTSSTTTRGSKSASNASASKDDRPSLVGTQSLAAKTDVEGYPNKKPRILHFYKCEFCRTAKKKCLPSDRQHPDKCDRCKEKGLDCSPPVKTDPYRKGISPAGKQQGNSLSPKPTPLISSNPTRTPPATASQNNPLDHVKTVVVNPAPLEKELEIPSTQNLVQNGSQDHAKTPAAFRNIQESTIAHPMIERFESGSEPHKGKTNLSITGPPGISHDRRIQNSRKRGKQPLRDRRNLLEDCEASDDDQSGEPLGREPPGQNWACPFYKLNPNKYFTCGSIHLKRFSDVTQHIRRKHSRDNMGISCPRCNSQFRSHYLFERHITSNRCVYQHLSSDPFGPDLLSGEELLMLRHIPGDKPEDKWYWMWGKFFAGHQVPEPSISEGLAEPLNFFKAHSQDALTTFFQQFLRDFNVHLGGVVASRFAKEALRVCSEGTLAASNRSRLAPPSVTNTSDGRAPSMLPEENTLFTEIRPSGLLHVDSPGSEIHQLRHDGQAYITSTSSPIFVLPQVRPSSSGLLRPEDQAFPYIWEPAAGGESPNANSETADNSFDGD